ncbi:MAG: FkbM family methyltransferase [Caulobacteraceae bacterium]|nr:FkbM family methyltransferase [Caulobacteraceae bacterium]
MDRNLIFDIGLHRGLDANFYLRKGFRVVGLEAVQDLCAQAAKLNKEFCKSGRLTIVQKALYGASNESVEFYINPEKDDWGSLFRGVAEKGVGSSRRIFVETITLSDLIEQHGTPYYLKCDIEGGDSILSEQLCLQVEKPEFVSLEATNIDDFDRLRMCGYDRFQLVNQYVNPFTMAPRPAREGRYAEVTFNHHMSGLFGKELQASLWVDFAEVTRQYLDWRSLRERNENLAPGWLDVHACRQESL